jgi:hypothetical protein
VIVGLFEELLPLLRWHADRKGESLDDWFNRQLHERVAGKRLSRPVDGWARVRLSSGDVNVSEERWSLERLANFEAFHQLDQPVRPEEALAVFRGWGREVLIDGQKRVNYRLKKQIDGEHRVFIIEPQNHQANPFPGAKG